MQVMQATVQKLVVNSVAPRGARASDLLVCLRASTKSLINDTDRLPACARVAQFDHTRAHRRPCTVRARYAKVCVCILSYHARVGDLLVMATDSDNISP